jgi:phosphate starvation-inducible PhoH-like protein
MPEKILSTDTFSALDIYGPNDINLNVLRAHFPKLRVVARGDMLKLIGDDSEIKAFEKKFNLLLVYFERFNKLTPQDVAQVLSSVADTVQHEKLNFAEVIVHGRNGKIIKARTPNQLRLAESVLKNDLVFAIGPAGTGKTYTAVALAVRALKNKEIKRIILTRPAVEAGENLGFLPGDLKDKLDPYLQPLYDALRDMLPTQRLLTYLEDGTIEVAPLAFMRGRTLDHAFAILDEAQNCKESQLKMFLTRMGPSARFVVTGDITQIDLPGNQKSGLPGACRMLKNIPGIDVVQLDERDIVRHRLVGSILKAYGRKDDIKI